MSSFYAGVCISSIKPSYGPDSNGIVRFHENDATGDKAMFLHLVREIGDISRSSGSKEFEATVIDYTKAKEIIEKEDTLKVKLVPMFCVHGYSVEPNSLFDKLNSKIERFVQGKKYYPVPVIWPCRTNSYLGAPGRNYEIDQTTTSQSAGALFKQLADLVPNDLWPKKALMTHSMGNHVVFNGACAEKTPDAKFDDIFMVAADIEFDSFHKDPGNGEGVFANKKQKAQNFLGLLEGGKIHVLHNVHDRALLASANYANSEYRLGQRGIGMYKYTNLSWYDDKQKDLALSEIFDSGKYVNVDCQDKPMSDGKYLHSYQFDDWAIDYYSDPEGKREFRNKLHSYKMK